VGSAVLVLKVIPVKESYFRESCCSLKMCDAGCSSVGSGLVGTCRVCFEDIGATDGDGVQPCECMDGGSPSIAHMQCIQRWISLRPNLSLNESGHRDLGVCEVCSTPWKQTYEVPQPAPAMTREQYEERALNLLLAAFARTQGFGGMQPRGNDAIILRELGPHFEGPWQQKPSLYKRLSKRLPTVPSLFSSRSRGSSSSHATTSSPDSSS
jgi:hypothetical protein